MGRQGEAHTDRVWPGFWLLVSLSPYLLVWPLEIQGVQS